MLSPVRFGINCPQQAQTKAQPLASQATHQLSNPYSDSVKFGSFGGATSGSNFHVANGSRSSHRTSPPTPPTAEELRVADARRKAEWAQQDAELNARIDQLDQKMNTLLKGPVQHAELPTDVDQALARIAQAHPEEEILEVLGRNLTLGQFGAPRKQAGFFGTEPNSVDELPAATIPALRSRYLPSLEEWPVQLKFYLMQQTVGRFKNGQKEEKLFKDPDYAQEHEREIAAILSQVLTTVINQLDPANA